MKKIFVTTFIFAISLFCCGRACAYEIITLDTSALPSFSSTVLDTVESDDNPVLEQNDSSKEQPVDSAGSFIKVPKAKKQETIAPQEPLRSELGQYNPAASKFVLFDAVSKAAKDVYNLEIERTDVPSALLRTILPGSLKIQKPLQWRACISGRQFNSIFRKT